MDSSYITSWGSPRLANVHHVCMSLSSSSGRTGPLFTILVFQCKQGTTVLYYTKLYKQWYSDSTRVRHLQVLSRTWPRRGGSSLSRFLSVTKNAPANRRSSMNVARFGHLGNLGMKQSLKETSRLPRPNIFCVLLQPLQLAF